MVWVEGPFESTPLLEMIDDIYKAHHIKCECIGCWARRSEEKTMKPRGFAALSAEERKAISSKGGKAAHLKGTGHQFTTEEAREAGRRGGKAVHAKRKATKVNAVFGGIQKALDGARYTGEPLFEETLGPSFKPEVEPSPDATIIPGDVDLVTPEA